MEYYSFDISVSIPLLNPLLWLALAYVVILALGLVATRAAGWWRGFSGWFAAIGTGDKSLAGWIKRFAFLLAPLGVIVFLISLWRLGVLLVVPAPEGTDFRVHYFAFVAVATFIGALAGVPIAIARVEALERQTKAQEEGLVTDRINKAVEGLGAEKTVKQVHETPHYRSDEDGAWLRDDEGGPMPALGPDGEPIVDRQAVELSVPNLEVRIGAIYALERIARLNPDEHIQIMEILTAYIRENAPASGAPDLPEPPEWFEGKNDDGDEWDDAFEAWRAEHRAKVNEHRPREDIQIALTVIGRRSDDQIGRERGAWVPFEDAVPDWPDWQADADGKPSEAYEREVAAWREALETWRQTKPAYRLDLRGTNLTGADMARGDFALARFDGARLQGADLREARLQGADLQEARMQGADLTGARLQRADLTGAQMQRADLHEAQMQGADLGWARMQGAFLRKAQMQGAELREARLQRANLYEARLERADLREARMQGADLRQAQMQRADLREARLQGAGLRQAQMQGAFLRKAQMQGTNLMRAEMQGAYLRWARMQGAELQEARLQRAELREAHMQGANLLGARMQRAGLQEARLQGADLRWAQMQGADLQEARLQGADLRWAQMQGAFLREAQMQGAEMQGADLMWAEIDTSTAFSETQWVSLKAVAIPPGVLTQGQINSAFGDASTGLPDDLQRPDHWPQFDMNGYDYDDEWEKWRDAPDGYAPPEPPSEGGAT